MSKIKKIGYGCLVSFGVFILICVLIAIFADDSENKPASVANNDSIIESQKFHDSLAAIDKKKIDAGLKRFKTEYDDIEKITWIYSKSIPKYSNTKAFYNYIGLRDSGEPYIRLVVRYHGNDWLFINSIIVKTDKQTATLDATDSKRDHNTDVWEWIDIEETTSEYVLIQNIINSKDPVKVRFVGSQYTHDWILPKNVINGLKEIEDYYQILNSYYVSNLKPKGDDNASQ